MYFFFERRGNAVSPVLFTGSKTELLMKAVESTTGKTPEVRQAAFDKAMREILGFKSGAVRQTAELERAPNLLPKDRKVETAAYKKYTENPQALVNKFLQDNGKTVNTDEARKLFIQEGYNGANAAAVQEPSSAIAKEAWRNLLETGKEKFATIFSGGSGAGKTSAIRNIPKVSKVLEQSAAVLDGNLSSYKGAVTRLNEAISAGKKPKLVYVYRDPVESFEFGVVKRMKENASEMGRIVPAKVVAKNHVDSWEVINRLYNEAPNKSAFHFIDNSLGNKKSKLVSIESLREKVRYPQNLEEILLSKAKELYEKGKISKEQYQQYIQ